MKLFDDKVRTRMEPKAPGEDDYSFYDSCASPGYDDYRTRLNGWFAEMPEAAQKDLLPRFLKNESLKYQRALAELTVHAALKRQGYAVEIHFLQAAIATCRRIIRGLNPRPTCHRRLMLR
jgi:hypothetical protein